MIDRVESTFQPRHTSAPVLLRRRVCVGIVGHRYLGPAEGFVTRHCRSILEDAHRRHGAVTAISALAEGSDSLFAEVAIELKIPLVIVRPFREYALDFRTGSARTRYARLRQLATQEIVLAYGRRSDKAYRAAMNWVVARSDLLVAAWDGRPAAGYGGTSHAVEQASRRRGTWIHLDVIAQSVTFKPPEAAKEREAFEIA
jgi:hypothetical protein